MTKAGISLTKSQYGAVARMRWQMLRHSLRTDRGQFELGARFVTNGIFLLAWSLASIGLGFASWVFTSQGNLKLFTLVLWPILLLWQMVPVMLASFQEGVDLTLLLRFPVSFRTYSLLYLYFGLFDLSSLMGALALFGSWLGIVIAQPSLIVVATLVLGVFGVFNLLLTRMIFAWIDKWLARRKTREVLGMVLLFFFLGLQLLNPAFHANVHGTAWIRKTVVLHSLEHALRFFPPGLAATTLAGAAAGHRLPALTAFGELLLTAAVVGALLTMRLHAEFRGESLGESPQAAVPAGTRKAARRELASTSETASPPREIELISAILAKELRYLARSGVMLFSLVAPLLLIFVIGGARLADNPLALQFALPIGVAYCFLPLTRQVCNSLGGEGAGIQLYFLSPTPMRTVMLAKNLLQAALFSVEVMLAATIIFYRFGRPPFATILLTACWLLFALPVELAAGNILSITMAYRMTLTRLSREEGATGNGLVSLLVQLITFGVGAVVYLLLSSTGQVQLAPVVLLLLAVGGVFLWMRVLASVDRLAAERQEDLIATLVRAA